MQYLVQLYSYWPHYEKQSNCYPVFPSTHSKITEILNSSLSESETAISSWIGGFRNWKWADLAPEILEISLQYLPKNLQNL